MRKILALQKLAEPATVAVGWSTSSINCGGEAEEYSTCSIECGGN